MPENPVPHSSAYDPHATARTGVVLPPSPTVRLVPAPDAPAERTWDCELPSRGRWRVRGTAGSGVTSLLIDTVIAKLRSGADPNGILVIASSKESGGALRRELASRLENYAADTTLVRSMHSLAFALLRRAEEPEEDAAEREPLRLITGAEQDAVIQELLQGHVANGALQWPEFIRPAVGFVGFARQLRDFLLRAIERGLGPDELIELGRAHQQDMWVAAGHFLREYEEVMALYGHHSYSAAELVTQVLLRPELTDEHQWHTIIVDDAQLLTPSAGQLIERLAVSTQLTVVAGDPEQAVFAFRGANADFFDRFEADHELELVDSRRTPPPACVAIVGTKALQADVLADAVRRRHLEDGVDWRDIAVIVRSSGDIGPVRRTLLAAGVPVHISPTDVVLSEQRLVSAVLLALRALQESLTNVELEELITGPIGGADPVSLRRLIRGLRRFDPATRGMDTLRTLLDGELPDFGDVLTERELAILNRVRGVLTAGREAIAAGGSAEEVLWAVWSATGLAERLQAAALRGGATGSQADRDLDAMMALFDAAGDFSERRGTGIDAFAESILDQELPTGVRDRRVAPPQAVSVLTAHGAVGYEFNTVVVLGAQEGTWPSLGETGSLFGQEDLVDLLDEGIDPSVPVSHLAERLAEERRLFHVATTRHTDRLLIVAINAPDGDEVLEPSRFIEEYAAERVNWPDKLKRQRATADFAAKALGRELGVNFPAPEPAQPAADPGRELPTELDPLNVSVLSVPALVSQLRKVVADASGEFSEQDKNQASRQLARLAEAGVPGAAPEEWWNARGVAGERELTSHARLSPSKLEALLACPLNALLGNLNEDESTPIALTKGSMAHAFLESLATGAASEEEPSAGFTSGIEEAKAMTVEAFASIQDSPQWKRETEREVFETLLDRTARWVAETRSAFELVGAEVPVRVDVGGGVTISGVIDRLERTPESGEYVVVDLKTGATPLTREVAAGNVQLGAYQLALSRGTVTHNPETGAPRVRTAADASPDSPQDSNLPPGLERGGGILVYPAAGDASITTREQVAWSDEDLEAFAQLLPPLVEELKGPRVSATPNPGCDRCALKNVCPAQPEGRMITDAS